MSLLGVAVPLNHEREDLLQLSYALAELKYRIMALTWLFFGLLGTGVGGVVPEEPLLGDEGSLQDHRTTGPEGFYLRGLPKAPGNGWPFLEGAGMTALGTELGGRSDSLKFSSWGCGGQWVQGRLCPVVAAGEAEARRCEGGPGPAPTVQ